MCPLRKYEIPPPRIIHNKAEKQPLHADEIDEAIDLVRLNAKLTKNPSSLLRFYAKCKQNSTPPLSYVLKQTGIPDKKGWRRSRRKLEQLSLITYRNNGVRDHSITVNWPIICGLAMLKKPIKPGGKAHLNYSSSFRKALDNINRQSNLTKDELYETATLLSFLSPSDLKKVSEATIPTYPNLYFIGGHQFE